jgi:valyl-tRNA synthetase
VETIDPAAIAARSVARTVQVAIPLAGVLDLDAERTRIGRELGKLGKELETRNRKLNNPSFLERAPASVVNKERDLHRQLVERKIRLEHHLANLGPQPGSS